MSPTSSQFEIPFQLISFLPQLLVAMRFFYLTVVLLSNLDATWLVEVCSRCMCWRVKLQVRREESVCFSSGLNRFLSLFPHWWYPCRSTWTFLSEPTVSYIISQLFVIKAKRSLLSFRPPLQYLPIEFSSGLPLPTFVLKSPMTTVWADLALPRWLRYS